MLLSIMSFLVFLGAFTRMDIPELRLLETAETLGIEVLTHIILLRVCQVMPLTSPDLIPPNLLPDQSTNYEEPVLV